MVTPNSPNPLIKSWQEGDVFHLDVRELLEHGGEPYPYIMDCLRQLTAGQALAVHALFEPQPLITQVRRMGFEPTVHRQDLDHWVVHIQAPG